MRNTQTLDRLYTFMDGRTVVLEGISGTIRYDCREAKYPYVHNVVQLQHCPDAAGKRTVLYAEIKTMLRDAWETDVLFSECAFEKVCAEAERLGFWQMEALYKAGGSLDG